jgi:hypothetical protein
VVAFRTDVLVDLGYRAPGPGAALRVAFVGQGGYFRACSLERPAEGLEPAFVEYKPGLAPDSAIRELAVLEPHVVVAFRPELFPEGMLAGSGAATVGYLTEPLPRPGDPDHADLERRRARLAEIDAAQFDRIVCFDPVVVPTVEEVVPVWRSQPLPVSDAIFAPVRDASTQPQAVFIGRSTMRRERFLTRAKHELDLIHGASGFWGDRLRDLLAACDVGVNVHNKDYPTYENRVSIYLAAGLLVVSEPLDPRHGLAPGSDYLEVTSPPELHATLAEIAAAPTKHREVRLSGREKAEAFRASHVYRDLLAQLLEDLAAAGTTRSRR